MVWYEDLYVGESIVHKTNKIKWKIRMGIGQIGIYVIVLASSEKNLLDIIYSGELLQRGYPKKKMCIVGLAGGYEEALVVAASIVNEVYQQTGAFAVRKYLIQRRGKKETGCQS